MKTRKKGKKGVFEEGGGGTRTGGDDSVLRGGHRGVGRGGKKRGVGTDGKRVRHDAEMVTVTPSSKKGCNLSFCRSILPSVRL